MAEQPEFDVKGQSDLLYPIRAFTDWPLPQTFQELDAANYQAILANPPRARLTCDRNGLDDKQAYRAGWLSRNTEVSILVGTIDDMAAATSKLNERIAVLEADNKALEDRKDALVAERDGLSNRLGWMRLAMKKWRTVALERSFELVSLKKTQAPPVKSSPVPAEPGLPEPAKSSQDAVWRNATRFSR